MSYPSLEQYQEALQHPRTALLDPELRAGSISTSGLGLPLVMCGGFALTYTVAAGQKKYALRCFHKLSPDLERRYHAISAQLKQTASSYFVPFEFQGQGVRIAGGVYPVVKMAWAKGETLGDFVSDNYRSKGALAALRTELTKLAAYLEQHNISHGDIQPGNVMVSGGGAGLQLIDYDGMFVPALQTLKASESGHRNFQHPKRASQFDATLDRFSFISLNVALRALEENFGLWSATHSDADSFLFRSTDFSDPGSSSIFQKLIGNSAVSGEAKALASIALSDFSRTPSLADFLSGKGVPQQQIVISPKPALPSQYVSQYTVVDARNYTAFLKNVGSMVELIGQITDVKRGYSPRSRRPYLFVNFGDWRGNIVKLTVWSASLARLQDHVTKDLVGQWVSVVGLVEPPYVNKKYNYSHISIDITGPNQIRVINQPEAAFRLGGMAASQIPPVKNREIIEGIRGGTAPAPPPVPPRAPSPVHGLPAPVPPKTSNLAILQQMQRVGGIQQSSQSSQPANAQVIAPSASKPSSSKIPWWIWLVGLVIIIVVSQLSRPS